MEDGERKKLVWDIRKSLLSLSSDELFQIAADVGPVSGRDPSELDKSDAEGCFEHLHNFMYSKQLLEAEDRGMVELLVLKDAVDAVVRSSQNVNLPVDPSVQPSFGASPHGETIQSGTDDAVGVVSSRVPPVVNPLTTTTHSLVDVRQSDVQDMLSQYEDLSKKLQGLVNKQSSQVGPTASLQTLKQPTTQNSNTLHSHNQTKTVPSHTQEKFVSLKDLPCLPRREFKVQGGQIGDHTSDISYNSVCRQIEEGLRDNFTEPEIVRGVLRIIKPGDFKDMLMNKEDMTITELRGFLLSHLGEKSAIELFQELMCAKQGEHESPQQFLYRVIGLKQRVLFSSKQTEAEIRYSPETVQGVFLHTVYQGIGHKHSDIRRELKPFLSDNTVTDETILRHVMKITTDENERQRRLGSTHRQKYATAHSAQTDGEPVQEANTKRDTTECKNKTDTIKELTEKMDALTKLVDSLAETVQRGCAHACASPRPKMNKRERQYGCPKCRENNLPDCRHCFSCGEEGHRALGCLNKTKQQGNLSRSLGGDKQ